MIAPVREWLRLLSTGDAWGDCMGAWFDIAETLYHYGDDIPDEWQFSPGCSVRDPYQDATVYLSDVWVSIYAEHGAGALVDAGNVLSRWRDRIKSRGEDY